MKIGITSKLTIAFALAILPFFFVTGFGYYNFTRITKESEENILHLEILSLINQLTISINHSMNYSFRYVVARDIVDKVDFLELSENINDIFSSLKKRDFKHLNVVTFYDNLEIDLLEYFSLNDEIIKLTKDQLSKRYMHFILSLRRLMQDMVRILDELQTISSDEMKEFRDRAETAQSKIQNILMISWTGSILFSMLMSFLISRYFGRSIKAVDNAARKIGSGDLKERIRPKSRDELGELIDTFNDMAEKLQHTTVSKDYFDNILQTMNDALIVISPDGTIQGMNMAAGFLLEYDKDDLNGKNIDGILMNRDFLWDKKFRELINIGKIIQMEGVCITRNGTEIPVMYSVTEMMGENENLTGYVCVIQNVTFIKKAEEEIKYLTHQMLKIQEEERGRISREIHDNLGGSLQAFKILLHNFSSPSAVNEKKKKDYAEMVKYLDEIINTSRKISRSLSPVGFKSIGLPRSILELAGTFNRTNKIDMRIEVDQMNGFFQDNWDVNIYRIIQEALANIVKHSGATSASIAARASKSRLVITVRDNGRGINLEKLRSMDYDDTWLGLLIMRERAELLNGSFHISSREGKGTVIKIEIPRK